MTLFIAVPLLIVGRLLIGFGVGIYTFLIPLILNQTSPPHVLGKICNLIQVQVSTGQLVATLFGFGLPTPEQQKTSTPQSNFWRVNLGFPIILQVIQLILIIFVFKMDTPAFFWSKQDFEQAHKSLQYIYGPRGVQYAQVALQNQFSSITQKASLLTRDKHAMSKSETEYFASERSNSSHQIVPKRNDQNGTQNQPLCGRTLRNVVLVCYSLTVLQHLTGVSAIFLYSTDLFGGTDANFHQGIRTTALIFGINAAASYVFLTFVDCFGRKTLITLMYVLKAAALALLAIFGWLDIEIGQQIALLAFMVFFQFGIGPLLWTYLPQCLPSHAINLGASLNWAAFICVSLITKPLINTGLGISGTFMIFASCCFVIGIYCAVCLVESRGKTKKQIIAQYAKQKGANSRFSSAIMNT